MIMIMYDHRFKSIASILLVFIICLPISCVICKDETLLVAGTVSSAPRGLFWDQTESPLSTSKSSGGGASLLQLVRDEFNTTDDPFKHSSFNINVKGGGGGGGGSSRSSATLPATIADLFKKVLLRYSLAECCPSWTNLIKSPEILDEQKRLFGKQSGKQSIKPSELLGELKQAYFNITYMSIDGRQGDNELDKYYKFYDDVHYYLRLMMVAENYLLELDQRIAASTATAAAAAVDTPGASSDIALNLDADIKTKLKLQQEDIDFKRYFTRQIRSISFRVSQDPIISSFIDELLPSSSQTNQSQSSSSPLVDEENKQQKQNSTQENRPIVVNANFEFYESFIRYTKFGQYYASNISMIRESVQVFDLICSHLNQINFPSNLTRPSKQYELIRRMSYELFRIRHDLLENISLRVLSQNQDVKRIFNKLNDLIAAQPHIRMLGDEFSSNDLLGFSDNVRQLTHLLDLYTTNNMTHLSFYNQLSDLPEDFILLGVAVAREYENRELSQYNRFTTDLYNWEYPNKSLNNHQEQHQAKQHNDSQSPTDSARQSNRPLLYKLFG